jgi:hypothetical protein
MIEAGKDARHATLVRVTPSACITARRSLAFAFRRRASDATID